MPSLLLAAASVTLGCDGQPTQPSQAAALTPTAESRYAPRFDPDNFVSDVDNRFFPLVSGTRYVFVGEEDCERQTNMILATRSGTVPTWGS
jgi:hypothetical protein